ncbi:MAG: hypothetical protein LBP72_06040 [Dysgonamonadaceae bacterium]|jgi:hypothetical protein|nr:hypothetical protein [Dysgonamonadaceae bacterium]
MKKRFLFSILVALTLLSVGAVVTAQTFSLNDLSEADFEAGGNTQWAFEKYDTSTGLYSAFTTYGDSGRVNFFDRYNPERFGLYPIMSNPETLTDPYPVKRNSWFDGKDDYLYVARDYPEGTACVDLEYWTTIPATLRGYEVYSSPTAVGASLRNAAITFTVPADGYYQVNMSVLREDNIRTDPMTIFQRYRYNGTNTVPDVCRINQSFTYGAGGEVDTPPVAPENPAVGTVRYAAQTPASKTFFIYAKAGDKISFEADARSTNNPETVVRGAWARTKWTNLALTVTTEAAAKADAAKFVDPYADDPDAFTELNALLDQAEELIQNHNSNAYPLSALMALQTVFESIDNVYDNIHAMEIPGFVAQIKTAIDNYLASALGLKVRYNFETVNDKVVADASGSGYDGTLFNEASILNIGKYNVLSLGSGTGYLEMNATLGNVISGMENYTVSAYYRVNADEALSGNGNFLWAFSTQAANSAAGGQYIYYRMSNQKHVISTAGWNNEKAILLDAAPQKGAWQHVLYRQTGTKGELFINGTKVLESLDDNPLPQPITAITTATPYNWIGRPPFSGDNYLKNTMVYDFRLYNQAITAEEITELSALTADLDNELNFGTQGDFSQLTALISEYNAFLTTVSIGEGVGQYLQINKEEFEDAIAVAQTFVNANVGSQYLVDAQIKTLKAAYETFTATVGFVMVHPADAGETEYPFESGQYYIEVGNYYLTMPEDGKVNTYLQLRPYINNDDKVHNNQVWNIQYNPTWSDLTLDPPRALYSFVSDKTVWEEDGAWHMDEIGRMKEGNTEITQSETGSNWDWREHKIYFNGTAYALVNNHNSKALVFANETENEQAQSLNDKKFNFRFRSIDDVVANPKQPNAIQTPASANKAKIYGGWNEIVVSGASDRIAVYDISGRLIKNVKANGIENRIPVAAGLYIVKTEAKTAKVIVR